MQKESHTFGVVLIAVGTIFLLKNFIPFNFFNIFWNYLWPIALIVIGIQKISSNNK